MINPLGGSSKYMFNYGVVSSIGNVRESNQDSAFASQNLLVVADGMGGHAGGDTASAVTVHTLKKLSDSANPKGFFKTRLDVKEATEKISEAIGQVYLKMTDIIAQNPQLAQMGTTLTMLLRTDSSLISAHLGDSRCYLLRDSKLSQITHDHTFVQALVDQNHITAEEARNHPQRNVVMRVLGDFDLDIEPDLTFQQIQLNDRWFLCSDGIISGLRDEDIEEVLKSVIDPKDAAQKLVDLALEGGSTDNCTALVADIVNKSTAVNNLEELIVGAGETIKLEDFPELNNNIEGIVLDSEPEVNAQNQELLEDEIQDQTLEN